MILPRDKIVIKFGTAFYSQERVWRLGSSMDGSVTVRQIIFHQLLYALIFILAWPSVWPRPPSVASAVVDTCSVLTGILTRLVVSKYS